MNSTKISNIIVFIFMANLLYILAGCGSTDSNERDLFTTKAILNGQVVSEASGDPVENAKVVVIDFLKQGENCLEESTSASPALYDSTITDKEGNFEVELKYVNFGGPLCLGTFTTAEENTQVFVSDTTEFKTELKTDPPFDTVKVDLVLKSENNQ